MSVYASEFSRAHNPGFWRTAESIRFGRSVSPGQLLRDFFGKVLRRALRAQRETCSVLALGNWMRHMAPRSILEFIVVLLMRQAASFVVPALSKSLHLGTKGCLFDFTSELTEARYKALRSARR